MLAVNGFAFAFITKVVLRILAWVNAFFIFSIYWYTVFDYSVT